MKRRPPDLTTIRGRLKAERLRLDQTQASLAAVAGIRFRTLQDWENGPSSPNAEALAALSGVGVDVLYVVTGLRQEAPGALPESLELATAKAALAALESIDRRQLVFELLFGGSGR